MRDLADPDHAAAALRALETCRAPTAEDLDALVRCALVLARSAGGQPASLRRARALLARWREDGCRDPDLNLAEVLLTVSVAPAAARHRLLAMTRRDPETAAVEAVNRVFRGELRGAVELAAAHGWFLDRVRATEGLCYALWAAGLLDRFDEAEAVLEAWKRRHAAAAPETYPMVLQLESRLAHLRGQFPRELAALREADALCEAFDLRTARIFAEPNLAAALARCGEWDEAGELVARWRRADGDDRSLLEGYRNMARLEMALLAGEHGRAEPLARRVRAFCHAIQNVPLEIGAEFNLLLAAPAERFPARLERYRRMVHRTQIPPHLRRVDVLTRVADAGARSAREVQVTLRGRGEPRHHPLARVWMPRVEWIDADLYWDGVQEQLHLRGCGPLSLAARPVLQRLLRTVLDHPRFRVELPDLYRTVWGGEYDPLIHEGKVHVTLHRLRRLLDTTCPDAGGMLVLAGGGLGLDRRCTVQALEGANVRPAPPRGESARGGELARRVVETLRAAGELPPRELEARLGVSRSSLHHALRVLRADGRIARTGAGPSTRYRSPPLGPGGESG